LFKITSELRGVPQVVEDLSSNHKVPEFNPSTVKKSKGRGKKGRKERERERERESEKQAKGHTSKQQVSSLLLRATTFLDSNLTTAIKI
jgi:hypothetical protein